MILWLKYWTFRSSLPKEECRNYSFRQYCEDLGLDYETTKKKVQRQAGFVTGLVLAMVVYLL